MSIFQIENFLKKMYQGDYATLEEALEIIRQITKDRQQRVNRQRVCMRKMRKKITEMKTSNMRSFTNNTIKSFRRYIIATRDGESSLPDDAAKKCSDVIVGQLSKLMKQQKPERDSCELIDRIFSKVADKTAEWMMKFVESSDFKIIDSSPCDDKCKGWFEEKFAANAEEAAQLQESFELEMNKGSEETIQSMLSEVKSEEPAIEEESNLFLRPSQINVDDALCNELFRKLSQLQREKAMKEDAKAQKKANRDAMKLAKKKQNRLGQCLGNVDRKPQWEVEWIEKTDE